MACFTAPFGFKGHTVVVTSDRSPDNPKGLILDDGLEPAEGADAADLAVMICRHLSVKFMPKLGRGSTLRECCRALLEHLEPDETKSLGLLGSTP